MQIRVNRDWKTAFVCANAFLQLAEPLARNIGENVQEGMQPQTPESCFGDMVAAATNLGFAIELYLKLILAISEINVPKHHILGKLFAIIPHHFKVVINEFYKDILLEWSGKRACITVAVSSTLTELPKWHDTSSVSSDIESLFNRTGDIFSSWRYIYEFTDPGMGEYQYRSFEYGFLLSACKAIKATIEYSQTSPIESN